MRSESSDDAGWLKSDKPGRTSRTPAYPNKSRRAATALATAGLWLPGISLVIFFFVLPVGMILAQSVLDPKLTLKFYRQLLSGIDYWIVLWISVKIALISTIVSLVAAYPVAYLLVHVRETTKGLVMALVLLPFWTNILVRCYAWMLLLQKNGLVNTSLVDWLHIVKQPVPLVFNLTGVIIGMVHYLIPTAILILYAGMKGIDLGLLSAAKGLGASPTRAFWEVFFPLSFPVVRAASMLVFVLSLGFFVTPALLGGQREVTIAMLVNTYFTDVLNWGFGSALAAFLLVLTFAGLGIYFATQRRAVVGSLG
jgi:ABC-type spermidine/putrescine transport system permease subunit I